MDAEEINVVEFEQGKRSIEGFEEVFRGIFDDDFSLDNQAIAREEGKNFAELDFGSAISSGGFNVVYSEIDGTTNGASRFFWLASGIWSSGRSPQLYW